MSRPYIKLNSATYSTGVLSINVDYLRIRGVGALTVTEANSGFTQSISVTTTPDGYASGSTLTYSITLATSSHTYSLVLNAPSYYGFSDDAYQITI